ncbi:hypothetical protein ACFV3E_13565 [Streptomyces sp. NPDC059718]
MRRLAGRPGRGCARVVAGLVSYAEEPKRRGMLPEDAEHDEVARTPLPRALAGFTPEPGS